MDYSKYKFIKVKKEGKVAIFTLNRPESFNAIAPSDHVELEHIFGEVTYDADVNAIVLTGAGKAFCAGGDVKAMDESSKESDPLKQLSLSSARKLIHNLIDIEQPIIAAVNGHAVGLGATIALFCDVVIASEAAKIGDPHVKVGLVAGDGGAIIWSLLAGVSRAKEYLMTGDLMTATEAERLGLVNHVVPQADVLPRAMELANRLANGPTRAIRWTKLAINTFLHDSVNKILDGSLATETLSMMTADHKEAARAFTERRPPVFKGY